MDEPCCAVCAEPLQWVAYGPCGHRDVCAVCIARLRFVCHDRRCCICKSLSPSVFITRALGSYTRVINDFSIFPADANDGKVGSYWYHEDTQAFFDDLDAYKIIKAMCRLACTVCDKLEKEEKRNSKTRGNKFKSVEQLKDHLSRKHELFLCSLCLEFKKVFISEQKLYNRVQLRQHIRCGDSEVDGNRNERCGFTGHPLCEFCQRPFYGENELYFHMSTEHYTCHLCQRQQPSRCEYYKDYIDLENHFREAHFLCDDEACLEKKFIVFLTEADMKRHSALEHGGNMSRAKRRTALQLSTCFHHREREHEGRRVRPYDFHRGTSNFQHSYNGLANGESSSSNFLHDASSIVRGMTSQGGTSEIIAASTSVPSLGQLEGPTLDFRSVLMSGTEFPPLPGSSKRRRQKSKKKLDVTKNNHNSVSNASQSGASNSGSSLHSSAPIPPQVGSSGISYSTTFSSTNSYNLLARLSNGIASASSANTSSNDVGPSSSAPDLTYTESKCPASRSTQKGDDIQAANKSLVDRIYNSLEFDKDKFAAFKIISKEYREGDIDAWEYITYVHQFGLAHLIADLAQLCPDPKKQKELMEIHKLSLVESNENRVMSDNGKTTARKHSKKGKEKCEELMDSSKEVSLPHSIMNNFKNLKLNVKEPSSSSEVAESQEKGKPGISTDAKRSDNLSAIEHVGESKSATKKLKKKSKFLKTRLGESSETVQDTNCRELASDLMVVRPDQDSILASARGVWRDGGGRRLVSMNQARPSTR